MRESLCTRWWGLILDKLNTVPLGYTSYKNVSFNNILNTFLSLLTVFNLWEKVYVFGDKINLRQTEHYHWVTLPTKKEEFILFNNTLYTFSYGYMVSNIW